MSLDGPELLEPLATVDAGQEVTFSDPARTGLVVLHHSGQGEEAQSAGEGSVRPGAGGARSGVEGESTCRRGWCSGRSLRSRAVSATGCCQGGVRRPFCKWDTFTRKWERVVNVTKVPLCPKGSTRCDVL